MHKELTIDSIIVRDNHWVNDKAGIIFRSTKLQREVARIEKHPARRLINVGLYYSYFRQWHKIQYPLSMRYTNVEYALEQVMVALNRIYWI